MIDCCLFCRDLEDLKHVLLTNVVGTFAVTKAFLPLLKSGKKKTIINMGSDAGCLTQNASFIHDSKPSDAGMALSYRTSKVAVNMGESAAAIAASAASHAFTRSMSRVS